MLADAMRSMDVSHSLDSLISYPRLPYHVPPARVLIRFLSVSRVSLLVRIWIVDSSPDTCLSSVSPFVLSTCTLTFLAYVFLFSSRRLVYAYHYCLCLSFCSLSTRLSSRYFWTLTRHQVISLSCIFVLVSRVQIYIRVGDVGYSPSSIYFATTLKM